MKTTSIITLLLITVVISFVNIEATTTVVAATGATGGSTPVVPPQTTEERVTQLEAELLALSKENNLLTDTLKNNWNAFKTTCGAVLTTKCADIAKESDKFVEMVEQKEKCIREKGEKACFEKKKEGHHGNAEEHDEHERKLRGGDDHDDKDDRRRGGHHGDKKHGKKGHGGKHGGKRHQMPEPPVAKSVKCVLKQSFTNEQSVPAHCVHSAKRFDMYLKLHRPSKVVVMMPPPHRVSGWGIVGFIFQILLLCAIIRCCIKCVRHVRRKKCPVHQQQQQPIQSAQIVLGQPVVLTTATETEKF